MVKEMTNWNEIVRLFPINDSQIWLNNCGVSPGNNNSVNRVKSHYDDFSLNGIYLKKDNLLTIKEEIKTTLSKLLNCNPQDLALIHNTAEGANSISLGIQLETNDEIILLEDEYPSNHFPWLHWQEKGIKITYLKSKSSTDEYLHTFQKTITDKTKLVALSAVHWCTGVVLPVNKIAQICKEHDILFFLDGAQGVGHVPLDLNLISFSAFSAWKWLLGPAGLGVLYISNDVIRKVKPLFSGPGLVKDPSEYKPYDEILQSVNRYEYSTPPFSNWIYFHESLKLLESLGWENVMNYITNLSVQLANSLAELGYEVFNKNITTMKSAIISFSHPMKNVEELLKYLQDNKIIGQIRANRMRFSPHICNTKDQIDKVISVLSDFI